MNNVLVTYVYPSVQPYLFDLFDCINKQTTDEFEVIFFNDGLNCLEKYLDAIHVQYQTFNLSGNISEIRFKSFKILSGLKYDNIIFQDADDKMTNNRIEETISFLNSYQIVVNDIDLIDTNRNNITEKFWSDRLTHESSFDNNFIADKNLIGLGNSAIRKKILTLPYVESHKVIAVDWFFFYQLLKLSSAEGVFINSARTLYRQYEMNTVGLSKIDESRISQAKKVKEIHYQELIKIGYDFELQLKKLRRAKSINSNIINKKKNHFWWEETEYLQ